jgi:hypothetical protein
MRIVLELDVDYGFTVSVIKIFRYLRCQATIRPRAFYGQRCGRPICMSNFRKEKHCPSSFELVEVVNRTLNGKDGLRIAAHLASCDFCAAELEFYQHFPPASEEVSGIPIPDPLRELAEALLAQETIHISRLEYLLREAA